MRHQYSFILTKKIESFDDCPCIDQEGECEVLRLMGSASSICKCIGEDGEEAYKVADGPCPLQLKSGY